MQPSTPGQGPLRVNLDAVAPAMQHRKSLRSYDGAFLHSKPLVHWVLLMSIFVLWSFRNFFHVYADGKYEWGFVLVMSFTQTFFGENDIGQSSQIVKDVIFYVLILVVLFLSITEVLQASDVFMQVLSAATVVTLLVALLINSPTDDRKDNLAFNQDRVMGVYLAVSTSYIISLVVRRRLIPFMFQRNFIWVRTYIWTRSDLDVDAIVEQLITLPRDYQVTRPLRAVSIDYTWPWWARRLPFVGRDNIVYIGEVDAETGHPCGYGEWQDTAWHGEHLKGFWSNGKPRGPYRSRETGSASAIVNLRVGYVRNRGEPLEKADFLPRTTEVTYGVVCCEVSTSGAWFKSLPTLSEIEAPVRLLGHDGIACFGCRPADQRSVSRNRGTSAVALLEHNPPSSSSRTSTWQAIDRREPSTNAWRRDPDHEPWFITTLNALHMPIDLAREMARHSTADAIEARSGRLSATPETPLPPSEGEVARANEDATPQQRQRASSSFLSGLPVSGWFASRTHPPPAQPVLLRRSPLPRTAFSSPVYHCPSIVRKLEEMDRKDAPRMQDTMLSLDPNLPPLRSSTVAPTGTPFLERPCNTKHISSSIGLAPAATDATLPLPAPQPVQAQTLSQLQSPGTMNSGQQQRRHTAPLSRLISLSTPHMPQQQHQPLPSSQGINEQSTPAMQQSGDAIRTCITNTIGQPRRHRYEALLFVHGLTVDTHKALRHNAQMMALANYPPWIAPIVFSWPSSSNPAGYFAARYRGAEEAATGEALAQTIRALSDDGFTAVHLMVHSMGTRVLANAVPRIQALKAPGPTQMTMEIASIIILNPDFGLDQFVSGANPLGPQLRRLCKRVTLYGDMSDGALQMSEIVNAMARPFIAWRNAPGKREDDAAQDAVGGNGLQMADTTDATAGDSFRSAVYITGQPNHSSTSSCMASEPSSTAAGQPVAYPIPHGDAAQFQSTLSAVIESGSHHASSSGLSPASTALLARVDSPAASTTVNPSHGLDTRRADALQQQPGGSPLATSAAPALSHLLSADIASPSGHCVGGDGDSGTRQPVALPQKSLSAARSMRRSQDMSFSPFTAAPDPGDNLVTDAWQLQLQQQQDMEARITLPQQQHFSRAAFSDPSADNKQGRARPCRAIVNLDVGPVPSAVPYPAHHPLRAVETADSVGDDGRTASPTVAIRSFWRLSGQSEPAAGDRHHPTKHRQSVGRQSSVPISSGRSAFAAAADAADDIFVHEPDDGNANRDHGLPTSLSLGFPGGTQEAGQVLGGTNFTSFTMMHAKPHHGRHGSSGTGRLAAVASTPVLYLQQQALLTADNLVLVVESPPPASGLQTLPETATAGAAATPPPSSPPPTTGVPPADETIVRRWKSHIKHYRRRLRKPFYYGWLEKSLGRRFYELSNPDNGKDPKDQTSGQDMKSVGILDIDVIDISYLTANVASNRHTHFSLNREVIDDLREIVVKRRRAKDRSARLEPISTNVFGMVVAPAFLEIHSL